MHSHLEIIMPRTQDIGAQIDQIMAPFSEHIDENNEDYDPKDSFWDWYVIGGRFTGSKEMCGYSEEKLSEFYKKLQKMKVTVSGVICGKEKLKPESQIPMVDKLWNKHFPTENGEIIACPLFAHASNQYDSDDLISCDICLVEDIPEKLDVARVIIAGPRYNEKSVQATWMISKNSWNGVNHIDVDWDGNIKTALKKFTESLKHYREEYVKKVTPQPNWLCVTVDYHS